MQSIGYKKDSDVLMVVGPSERQKVFKHGKIKTQYASVLNQLAKELSSKFSKLITIPDDGVYSDFAEFFKSNGGEVIAYLPNKSVPNFSELKRNVEKKGFIERQTDWNWSSLNNFVIREASVVICLGYSSGVLIELGNIKIAKKWLGKKIKLFIDKRFVSGRLPKEIEGDLSPKYYNSVRELSKLLK